MEKILEHEIIFCEAIDKYEFYNFCGYYCSNEKQNKYLILLIKHQYLFQNLKTIWKK